MQVVSYLLAQNFYAAIQQRWMIHFTVLWHYLALMSSAGLSTSRSIPVVPAVLLLLSFGRLKSHLTGIAIRGPTSIVAILLWWLSFEMLASQATVTTLWDSFLVEAAFLRRCCCVPSPSRKTGVLSAFGLVLSAFGPALPAFWLVKHLLSGPGFGPCMSGRFSLSNKFCFYDKLNVTCSIKANLSNVHKEYTTLNGQEESNRDKHLSSLLNQPKLFAYIRFSTTKLYQLRSKGVTKYLDIMWWRCVTTKAGHICLFLLNSSSYFIKRHIHASVIHKSLSTAQLTSPNLRNNAWNNVFYYLAAENQTKFASIYRLKEDSPYNYISDTTTVKTDYFHLSITQCKLNTSQISFCILYPGYHAYDRRRLLCIAIKSPHTRLNLGAKSMLVSLCGVDICFLSSFYQYQGLTTALRNNTTHSKVVTVYHGTKSDKICCLVLCRNPSALDVKSSSQILLSWPEQ